MAKYCSNCGKEVKENQDVCLNCGVSLKKNNSNSFGKSRIAAGLLGIFLGTFGIHNYYLGNNSKATTQLLITVLSCGILSIVSAVWGLVEGIQILTGTINTDSEGNPLSD